MRIALLATLAGITLASCAAPQRHADQTQPASAAKKADPSNKPVPADDSTTPQHSPTATTAIDDRQPISDRQPFPATWFGTWRGQVTAYPVGGPSSNFNMQLEIGPTNDPNTYIWRITYFANNTSQVRDYRLVALDATRGHFQIDEQNSIKIDAFFAADTLHSIFAVQTALIPVRYAARNDKLHFELESFNFDEPIPTGGEANAPVVLSHSMQVAQRATLRRVSHELTPPPAAR